MSSPFTPTVLSNPPVALSLLPYGLTFDTLKVDLGWGQTRDLLIGYADPKDHDFRGGADKPGRGFLNPVVGRYANRLPIKSVFNGVEINLPERVGEPGVCLHGGPRGLDTQDWTPITRATSSLFKADDAAFPQVATGHGEEALFRTVSPAGEAGFPLTVEFEGLAIVTELKVKYVLRAKIVEDGNAAIAKGTPINLTVHWGWNLGAFDGVAKETVLDHKMWIDSDSVSATYSNMLPTGKFDSTAPGTPLAPLNFQQGTPSDLASHRTIGQSFLPGGIDHNIIFIKRSDPNTPKVVLTSPDDKVSLTFRSNQSTVQAYTAGGLDGSFTRKELHKNGTKGYPQFGAMFLEFQAPLATFMHPELAKVAGSDTVLKQGEVYENWVEVDVAVRK